MSNTDKRKKRQENRKRKIEAYLAVAELNDSEKKRKVEENGNEPIEIEVKEVKPKVSGTEFEELKQRLRERKKALKCSPLFRLKTVGEEALLEVEKEKRVPLFMSDLQSLLTYCLCGDKAPYWPHRWCTLQKWNRLSNIVCLVVEGVGVDNLEGRKEEFSWIRNNLQMMEVISPACYDSSVAGDLALIPVSNRQQKQLIHDFGSLESAVENADSVMTVKAMFPVALSSKKQTPDTSLKVKLLLSAKQMIIENYPLPLPGVGDRFQSFVLTKNEYREVHGDSPLYSIDCEMCQTEGGMELTRICVVNEKLDVIYHSLVQPESKVVNYLTRYSGITSEMLENVTTRLTDVQSALKELLPEDCILVGQSLNSDLTALKMMHPYVIDTSVIFNITGDRRRKTKLQTLASIFLETEIQSEGSKGHNPEEDSKAAMNLVLLKLEEGYQYGDVLLGGRVPGLHEPIAAIDVEEKNIQGHDVVFKDSLVSTLSKTAVTSEKTVAVTVSSTSADSYLKLEHFKSELKTFDTGEGHKEVLEKGKTNAVEHNLSICHLDLTGVKEDKLGKRVEKICKEMYKHTSTNGLFMLILAGAKDVNAAAGVTIVKPTFDS